MDALELDRSTVLNLELFSTLRDGEKKGSLVHVLDQTATAMGGRLLRRWLLQPLAHKEAIDARLDVVSWMSDHHDVRDEVREALRTVLDIERLLSRLAVGIGNARDLVGP